MSPQPQAGTPSNALDAALEYARKGLPVFPCSPLDKKPLTPHGFKDATTDAAQIHAWWGKWPNAMIAAPTGPASGVWALDPDVDPVKQLDGIAALNQLVAQHGPLPQTPTSITPRGGKHLFFAWDPNVDIRNSESKVGPRHRCARQWWLRHLAAEPQQHRGCVPVGPEQSAGICPGPALAGHARQGEEG